MRKKMITATKRIWLTKDGKLVGEKTKGITSLFAGKGQRVSPDKLEGMEVEEGLFDGYEAEDKPKKAAPKGKKKAEDKVPAGDKVPEGKVTEVDE